MASPQFGPVNVRGCQNVLHGSLHSATVSKGRIPRATVRNRFFDNVGALEGLGRPWIEKAIVLEGSRKRRIDKKRILEGSRRRWIDKHDVLEGCRRRWIDKDNILEVPGGVASTKIVLEAVRLA